MKNPALILVLGPLIGLFMLHRGFDHLKKGELTYRGSVIRRDEQPVVFHVHVVLSFVLSACAFFAFLKVLLTRS